MSYKWCAVPSCTNMSLKTPGKLFVSVPKNVEVRRKWLELSQREHTDIANSSNIFFCEDHFNMENDMENYYKYKMGFSQKILLKDKVLPSKFDCQQDLLKKKSIASTSRSAFVKRQRKERNKQCEDIQKPLITDDPSATVFKASKGSETESEYETKAPGTTTKKNCKEIVPKKCVRTYTRQDFKPSGAQSTDNESRRSKKAPKTSAQRCREYRARKALLKQQSKQQQKPDAIVEIATEDIRSAGPSENNQASGSSEIRTIERREKSAGTTRRQREKKKGDSGTSKKLLKKAPKSSAQRGREYRARKSLLKQQSKQQQKPDAIVEIATKNILSAGPSKDNQDSGSSEIRTIERRVESAQTSRRLREKKKGDSATSKKLTKNAAQYMREYRKRKKL